jgi:hypothetical protein
LALLAVALLGILLWLPPDPSPDANLTAGRDPATVAPWSACARAVAAQLGNEVELAGPTRIEWGDAGRIADVYGIVATGGGPDQPFGCRTIQMESRWEVDRLVFAP